jgi:serine/threonine protein kinase
VKAVKQELMALSYLHSNSITHRDLKVENIVYSENPDSEDQFDKLELKLLDFGFAKKTKGQHDLTELLGTPYYIAPEIINREEYGQKADIWSLGVVTYLIMEGNYPFNGRNRNELFNEITAGELNFEHEVWVGRETAKDFITKCCTFD